MNTEFWISEILFFIVYTIAIFVLREFIRTKDGMLRKIMIGYFAIEVFVYMTSAWDFLAIKEGWPSLSISVLRLVVLGPKVAIKGVLLWWLIKNRQNKNK